ncbi:hypothetical protein [Glutamicibacter sp. TV12E]
MSLNSLAIPGILVNVHHGHHAVRYKDCDFDPAITGESSEEQCSALIGTT